MVVHVKYILNVRRDGYQVHIILKYNLKLGLLGVDLCSGCVFMKLEQLEKVSKKPASATVARIPFMRDVRRLSSLSKIRHIIPPTEAP